MLTWLKVNPIGVIIGALSYLLIGAIFYSQRGLARFWPDLTQHMQKQADSMTLKVYVGAFLSASLIAYGMGCLTNLFQVKAQPLGFLTGFLVWVGFILPTIFSPVLFGKKPIEMFLLDALYYLIIYTVIGWIAVKFNT
jgi:hypothetical protein